jgi:hypothetical protein
VVGRLIVKHDEHGKQKLEEILESHIIPADALDYLLNDDLPNFLEKRKQTILGELRERLGIENTSP